MSTRDVLACLLAAMLFMVGPVGAKNAGGKGGGKGGGPGGGDDGGGDPPPASCQDVAAAFVYRAEHGGKAIGEDIILSSDEGCSTTLLASRANAVITNLAYHYNSGAGRGVVVWAERDPEANIFWYDTYAVSFVLSAEGAITIGPVNAVSLPASESGTGLYLQVPGDVRLITSDGDSSVHATILHREWIEEDVSASFELKLLRWSLVDFPAGPPEVIDLTVPAPGSLALCDGQVCDDGVVYRLSAPVFGDWGDGGLPALFGDFEARNVHGIDTVGGVLYWPVDAGDPALLAYGSYQDGEESIPRIAATHPVSPSAQLLVQHYVSERGRGEYHVSSLDLVCASGSVMLGSWEGCLLEGRQLAEGRFGAAWLDTDTLVYAPGGKSTDLYRLELATGIHTLIIPGGRFPVAGLRQ